MQCDDFKRVILVYLQYAGGNGGRLLTLECTVNTGIITTASESILLTTLRL